MVKTEYLNVEFNVYNTVILFSGLPELQIARKRLLHLRRRQCHVQLWMSGVQAESMRAQGQSNGHGQQQRREDPVTGG